MYSIAGKKVQITPGQLSDIGGKYALISLQHATEALKARHIDALVTAPIHKKIFNLPNSATVVTPFLKMYSRYRMW